MKSGAPRVLIFDWAAGGHHPQYMGYVHRALASDGQPIMCGPAATLETLSHLRAEFFETRAEPDCGHGLRAQQALRVEQYGVLVDAVTRTKPDRVFHLFADSLLPVLARRGLAVPTSLFVFRPRWHYPRAYATPLSPRDRVVSGVYEATVRRWARRREAHGLVTLDQEAAERWARQGLNAAWAPEPYFADAPALKSRDRTVDVAVFGAISPRKGVDRLLRALPFAPSVRRVVVAGRPDTPEYESELRRLVASLGLGGRVELKMERISDQEAEALLAGSRCVAVAYRDHWGMSRVLLEAAAGGTPVVANRHGQIAALVRDYSLGDVIDADDAAEYGAALERLVGGDRWTSATFQEGAAAFLKAHDSKAFEDVIRGVVL